VAGEGLLTLNKSSKDRFSTSLLVSIVIPTLVTKSHTIQNPLVPNLDTGFA
jgi:hypothetical protein